MRTVLLENSDVTGPGRDTIPPPITHPVSPGAEAGRRARVIAGIVLLATLLLLARPVHQ